MKYIVVLTLVLSLPHFGRGDDAQSKSNTLTPKEIAEGWILLFDGKTTFGWRPYSPYQDTKPNAAAADGSLILTGSHTSVFCTAEFEYFELAFEYRTEGTRTNEPTADANFVVRTPSDGKKPALNIGHGFGQLGGKEWGRATARFSPMEYSFVRQDDPAQPGRGSKQAQKEQYSVSMLRFTAPPVKDSRLLLRNVKLRPLQTKSLFNGKDLDGWKEFPGRKSKFSVTKEGWLSLKNGPGDLQTTGEWANFILQADCKTNGKNLNSGIFFRCLPGQYQMGYEAQIHNGFGPEKDYTLEVFDPMTYKLLEKKKEKNTAIDWGTGSIYRRVPARFQAAKDNEWFTMTVAAQGRHLATWVNGIQTADWTDNRPLEENARKGAYLKKGPISIQGHDPTTDLLFRNFRIAELPAK